MNNITKTILYLQMAAMLATVAFAGPKAAEKQVPFHGTIQTVETVTSVKFPIVFNSSIGRGKATHLGRFAWELAVEINNSDPTALTATGTGVLTVANGDSLFTEFTATASPTPIPDVIFIIEVHSITGGTGRFAGATGGFTRQALSNLALGFSSGLFDGTIVIHKNKKSGSDGNDQDGSSDENDDNHDGD
ncbi:MAG: hypothetical protein ABI651_20440 [Verrucomicrobiota bacterium]